MNKRRISGIGSISLGTILEIPSDASIVGLQLSPCDDASSSRDVSYILMTALPVNQLRLLYNKSWHGVEIEWITDKPDEFSFAVFKKVKNLPKSKRFLFFVGAFKGLSRIEANQLGLPEKDYRGKTFIFLIVREPEPVEGLVTLPLRFR